MARRSMSHAQIIALGFLLIIMCGTLLLMLPLSSKSGESAGVLTSFFTAVSASCVTGLVVVDTVTQWTYFGQAVIIVLIQVGGLGFMTMATILFFVMRRKMSVRERSVMAESISSTHIGRIQDLSLMIVKGTLLFELVGAILLAIRFVPQFGLAEGLWYSMFHSVSAFCNAGFDLMGVQGAYSSFVNYSDDILVNVTIMSLIIVGGIGFIVWDDVLKKGIRWKRYEFHTKIVLIFTVALTFGGALLFYLLERERMNVDMSATEQVLVSLFSSVTPRTAGFNTVDTASLSTGSKLLTIVLMVIGGSPGSTAGGIKTTTAAVLLLTFISGIRGYKNTFAFGRRVPEDALKKAILVFFSNIMLALVGAMLISFVQELNFSDIMFEVFSAIGTVGMSTGITRELHDVSRVIIALLMFTGRVGSVSFAIALMEKRAAPPISYPEEQITIG